jgi:PKD repeat protein
MLCNARSVGAVRTLLLALALLLIVAAPALAAPDPSFTVSPDPPVAGLPATFTSTTLPIVPPGTRSVEWDFAGDEGFEESGEVVTHTYDLAGEKTFRMRVTDSPGGETATESFTITVSAPLPTNRPPVAQFRFSPTSPLLGQEVLFESLSYDRDGSIASYEWDFDGDGFDDGNTARVAHAFDSTGEQVVRLRVIDDSGAPSAVATETVTVSPLLGNRLPVAQFSISDLEPEVGEQIALRSFSYDPDGAVVSQRWDLDGDGDFDENATGRTAFTTFLRAGPKILRLRVEDSSGAFQTETLNITVKKRPRSTPLLMNPFPVIRFAGTVTARGARVRTLEVQAPRRSKITVRCAGKTCPAKRFTRTSATRRFRFKRMAGFLKAGTAITVAVRKGNLIGKHTRWLVRGGKLPKRKDLCLYPRRSKPAPCPRS